MNDKRHWSRLLPPADTVTVLVRTISDEELPAQLCDESVDGFALLVRRHPVFEVGKQIEIDLPSKTVDATIRNVQNRGFMLRMGVSIESEATTIESVSWD